MQRNAGDASADTAVVRECARYVRMVGGNTAPICSDLSIFVGMVGRRQAVNLVMVKNRRRAAAAAGKIGFFALNTVNASKAKIK
ncbi:hypothetical protein QZM35_26470 [Burkholderia sp. AU45274]|uniref:hypothetical protein n=1 Tax=Burkholderia sp. AU45274 TaxID=3059205 RepID=UPI00264AE730|nr:hypothetical protein [Burkholderia sp. AU45274]MDN7491268.1 hypothetical protein [Burkholderia sp. AU45274]